MATSMEEDGCRDIHVDALQVFRNRYLNLARHLVLEPCLMDFMKMLW